jgi:hypothetical protein
MDRLNQKPANEAVDVREARFFLGSEVLDEIRPWYLEARSEDTDDGEEGDGSDGSEEEESDE